MEASYFDLLIETIGREALVQIQLKKLEIMLDPILKGNRFYREKLEEAGVRQAGDVRTLGDYQQLPLTTKEELSSIQMKNPPRAYRSDSATSRW